MWGYHLEYNWDMQVQEGESSFKTNVQSIKDILCRYSIEDVAAALFASCCWLPNIASPIQHQLLVGIFASLKSEQFQGVKTISTYDDFRQFLQQIYVLTLEFPILEDYVTEADWGNVKFHHKMEDYRIFFGTEVEDIYDYLQLFQIIFGSYDEEFMRISGHSPDKELYNSLVLQDRIISSITGQPGEEKLSHINLGYKEIPPEEFWNQIKEFYTRFDPRELFEQQFLEDYSMEFGQISTIFSNQSAFENAVGEGQFLPFTFLKWGNRYLIILPRRISEVMLEKWFGIFGKFKKELCSDGKKYLTHINIEVYKFLNERIRKDHLFGLTSALYPDERPHELLFASSILTHSRLLMVYVVEPFQTSDEIYKNLQSIAPKLMEASKLLARAPTSLGLNIERKTVQFGGKDDTDILKPLLLVVLPQITFQAVGIRIPKSLNAEFISLIAFLAIFDELQSPEEYLDFKRYCEDIADKVHYPLTDELVLYASFKDSHGVLIEGAYNPNLIMLEPHWGSNMRFESLSEFWSLYPDIGFFDHPRSWKPIRETSSRIRLEAKTYFGSALYTSIKRTKIFIISPFEYLNYEQGLVTDLLMQSLEDSMTRLHALFDSHPFFTRYDRLQLVFLPSTLAENENFKHIAHVKLNGEFWRSERGYPLANWPGIRLIFDAESMLKTLEKVTDNIIEIDLLLEILSQINEFVPYADFDQINKDVRQRKGKPARFKTFGKDKDVDFPEFINPHKPEIGDLKKAHKRTAELAASIGVKPGEYELEPAKTLLNLLRKSVVQEIDSIVLKFKTLSSIPYLIERIDALENDYEMQKLTVQHSLEHEVDFERDEKFSKEYGEFIQFHKEYRYLIEKFIQLNPHGKLTITKEMFQYLIALVGQLHSIYTDSDNLHYQIYPLGITIHDDYLIDVKYGVDLAGMENNFGRLQAKLTLGQIGNKYDRVETLGEVEEYINDLDRAFKKDLGFELRNLFAVLTVLSQWVGYNPGIKTSTYYNATRRLLWETCQKNVISLTKTEFEHIVDFLTLRGSDVVRITGQAEPADDIPIWEQRKRKYRYVLRPLIYLNRQFYWGPYSARRSAIVWTNVPQDHDLPADLESPAVDSVLNAKHKVVEKAIEEKALSIVKRYTLFAEPDVKLHHRDKHGGHPPELGDFDVLAFLPEKNIILNIECKEISRTYCLKDAKRMREQIFGRPGKKGYLERVENRAAYLEKNAKGVLDVLGFPLGGPGEVRVVSMFVSRDMFWWMENPARPTEVVFLRTDLMSTFVSNLLK